MSGFTPRWLTIARQDIGLREIPGKEHAAKITLWLEQLGAWWRDDETPWCGVACAAWMRQAGIALPKHWYRAKAWGDGWGTLLDRPIVGCVVTFEREGGGHVGLLTGTNECGDLLVLGGNQGNAVNIRAFPRERVARYIWPPGEPIPPVGPVDLPIASAPATTTEA